MSDEPHDRIAEHHGPEVDPRDQAIADIAKAAKYGVAAVLAADQFGGEPRDPEAMRLLARMREIAETYGGEK